MRCDNCGLESELQEAFRKDRQLLGLISRRYCPTCESKRQIHSALWWYVFMATNAAVVILAHPSSSASQRWALWPVMLILGFIPLTLVHESAHALVGRLVGLRVYAIVIGWGRKLASWKFLGTRWELRLLPVSGVTLIAGPPGGFYRLREWLTVLAGPGVHAILAVAAGMPWLLLNYLGMESGFLGTSVRLAFEANLWLLVINLLPLRASSPFGSTGSDGWNLFRLPFAKAAEMQERQVAYYLMESDVAVRRGDLTSAHRAIEEAQRLHPTSRAVQIRIGLLLTRMEDFDGARQLFSAILAADPQMKPAARYVLINNIAYCDAILGEADRLDEADRYSAEAYKNVPWVPAFVGTRGTVLVARGEVQEGITLLMQSMAQNEDESDKAENACVVAMAEASRGNLAAANQYLELARRWDPRGVLIGAASRKLEEATQAQPAEAASLPAHGARPQAGGARSTSLIRPSWLARTPLTPLSVANWGRLGVAWGFWDLLLWMWFSLAPGLGLMAVGAVAMVSGSPGMLLGMGVVGAWGALTVLPRGTWPEMGFGLAHLALAALLIWRYLHQRTRVLLSETTPKVGLAPSAGRTIALGAAIAGLASLVWLLVFASFVLSDASPKSLADSLGLLNHLWAWADAHRSLYVLVNLLAVLGVALGVGARASGARSRALSAVGIISGGCVLMLILIAIASA